MGAFFNPPSRARPDDAWDDEENQPFLGADPRFINEKNSPQSSQVERSSAKAFSTVKLIMALLTAVILGAFIRGALGSIKRGKILIAHRVAF